MSNKMPPLAFVDTNILLYAHDQHAGDKQAVAAALLAALWEGRCGVLSPQVLQEFLVNSIRKLQRPIALPQARDVVRAYGVWVVRDASVEDILRATELMELTGYSFWDSHILASAEASGAELLYSEAMQHGHKVAGLEIRNPFPPDYRV
ncbi:MAG: PIN domain-containing protein [Pseudomonadota bacterium]|nr:PIN domain-containing protein [Pseudomonadota bacterium]